ncbi:serine hydrolase [Mitsuaria sp. 7]|uniref:serine hydrolase n=1 Tax=Mitsuaria sp. 7 TaxID=1658665 RepID=UPI0007DCDB7E|nr:serine hydrolase [Mitsuaria sp. 7]ANH67398.1 beta-lactamase [Mitsuaria sp. 7]
MHLLTTVPGFSRLALGLVLIFTANAAKPQSPAADLAPTATQARLRDTQTDIDRALERFDVPGMAIAVVLDGKVVDSRGFGVRKRGETAPVDGRTLFDIAANSKAFTAAMLGILVDEGKLAWDDPVIRHLPDFQMFDPYVTREITVRDLLANRSGLGEAAGDLMWWPNSTFSTDEIIHNIRFLAPATSFRSRFTYEYLPYIVAGKIIALKTGKPWGEAVRERILSPLEMTRTTTRPAENFDLIDQAAPHSHIDGKIAVIKPASMENAAGAMGVRTSADDIAKWMKMLLDDGRLDAPGQDGKSRRLISAKQLRELMTPQTLIRLSEPPPKLAATRATFAAYGLGFDVRDYQGVKVVSHRGWQFGFYSTVVLVPSARLGIAIMTNAESGPALSALKYRLLDRYLGLPPADWIAALTDDADESSADAIAPSREVIGTEGRRIGPSLPLAAYDGEYRDRWYGAATIRTSGTRQVLSLAKTPELTGELEHFRHDTFIVRWKARHLNADAYVTFSLKPDGSVNRMTMAPISAETDSSFDFADLSFEPVKLAH